MAFLYETPEAVRDESTIINLGHLLTLRKVFKLRLEELAEEAAAQAAENQVLASAA
jgi:hypothetical protein